jgi:nucleoside-diphosphate-sugar epimerase
MHSVLITGASGFVGNSLCIQMLRQGYSIRAAIRSTALPIKNVEVEVVEAIDANTDWSNALAEVDVVIHLAARVHVMKDHALDPLAEFRKVNVDGTLNLARQAANAGIKRFIFISSVKVNGEYTETNAPFTELDKPHPQDAYGISKLEAELGLLKIAQKTGMEVVIIRPPLIYGPGVKANFASMLNLVKRGIPLPLGAINNKRSFIYVENLVSFILHCVHHPLAANQIFFVSDGQDLCIKELLSECATAMGVKSRLFPVPQRLLEVGAMVLGKTDVAQRLCGNLQVDITKARELLGWSPPYSVADGLKATVSGFMEK